MRPAPLPSALDAAAARLLEQERARLPDLSGVVVALPSLRAAPDFVRALGEAADAPALLLPRITTLRAWTETVAEGEILPDSQRETLLYRALREGRWFPGADLWQISADLRRLADELTRQRAGLPDSLEAFEERLARVHAASRNRAFRFEARLVHEMWLALARQSGAPDQETAHALRLARLAENADAPLYAVGLEDLTPTETAFLDAYAQRQPVHCLPGRSPSPRSDALQRAWHMDDTLRARASIQRDVQPESPLDGHFALFGASSLEEEAQAVDVKVRQWLLDGKQRIAVVAQDRLVARRARALLERASVLVEDETGWTLSTSSASTVVRRWLDALASHFYYQDLFDLVKSPFFLADWDASRRKGAIYRLERLVRRHSLVSHLHRYLDFARREEGLEDAAALLERLWSAQGLFTPRARLGLSGWLRLLLESLESLGIRKGLEGDHAGRQLMQLLQRLRDELARDATPFTLSEWKNWLSRQLESATFRDERISSPVVFTHLGNLRLRAFDAVLIAGADAGHLPGPDDSLSFFNPAVRAELGLPRREAALARLERELGDLISQTPELFVTWQSRLRGEPNALAPWFERLDVFHRLAYGEGLTDEGFGKVIAQAQVMGKDEGGRMTNGKDEGGRMKDEEKAREATNLHPSSLILHPSATPHPSDIPTAISVSAYASLIACPYQFFARHVLKLNELDEVQEGMEKRDFGDLVHDILHRFHERHPTLAGHCRETLLAELESLSGEVFAKAVEASYLSRGWALRWKALIPSYVDWQLARESAGWRVAESEASREIALELADGRHLTLKGRLDRRDEKGKDEGGRMKDEEKTREAANFHPSSFIPHPSMASAVLDYKTQSLKTLKDKLKQPGEDVQLALYALLHGDGVEEAAFVGLDGETVETLALDGDPAEQAQAEAARMRRLFDDMYDGAALPANGAEKTCAWCEMRGLCRKDHWDE